MSSGTITYNQYYPNRFGDVVTVDYSLNGGTSWTSINSIGGAGTVGTTTWSAAAPTTTLVMPGGALNQASVMLRWFINSPAGGLSWTIDNIVVSGVSNPFTNLADATPGGTWSSSVPGVASITSTGTVFGITAGSANISYAAACGTVSTSFTVNPAPGVITGTSTVCVGSSVTLGNSLSGGAWSSDNIAVASVNASTGQVFGVSGGTASIYYTTSCGSPAPVVMTVRELPDVIAGPTSLCASSGGTLTNSVTGGTWSTSNGSVVSINASTGVMASFLTTGVPVTITYSNGCGSGATTTVTVSGAPGAISGVTTLCVPSVAATTLLSQNFNTGLTGAVGGTWSIVNTVGNSTSFFDIRTSPGYISAVTGD